MPAKHIRIAGRVQGVFFRARAEATAQALNIRGWVKNDPDGSVLIHAEGDEASLEKFLQWCHVGSPSARVESVSLTDVPEEKMSSFAILQ